MQDYLFALVFFTNYVETIMLRLDAVLIWGHLFRHNVHKAAIILVIACFIYILMLLMLYFLVFYGYFDGMGKIWDFYSFWLLYM